MKGGSVRLARRVFAIAGIYGLIVLLPLYFAEPLLAARAPVNHPEYFYGFIGAASVFQLVYLTIARDPVRFRPLMPLAVLAKLNFRRGGHSLLAHQSLVEAAGLGRPAAWPGLRVRVVAPQGGNMIGSGRDLPGPVRA